MTPRLALLAALLAATDANAACTVSSSGVNFGTYIPSSSTATDATGTVTVTCTSGSGGTAPRIRLSIGGGASYAGRRMSSGADLLSYQLYTSSARSIVWGDGTASTAYINLSASLASGGGTQAVTIYGRIVALQVANPGAYSDVVIATVTY